MFTTRNVFLLLGLTALLFPALSNSRPSKERQAASTPAPAPNSQQPAAAASTSNGQAAKPAGPESKQDAAKKADATGPNAAWDMLTQGAASSKLRDRSDALSALTIVESDRRAVAIVTNALSDKDETIRVIAVTSLGEMKARSAIPKLREALDDKSPEVSFAAAQALWKMGDRSGRDIFYDVLAGERKVKPGLIKSKMRQARTDMHDPKALALIGVNEASGAFLGPFSMGVSMVEESAKNNGASVQALCALLLATDDSHETVDQLTSALGDKNWTVRAAAARSIAKLNDRGEMPQLRDMMLNDKSQPVRFAAAAAIIRIEGHSRRGIAAPVKPGSASPTASSAKTTVTESN